LKIIDFGKNTYQYEIDFKFDCISPEIVRKIVENLHIVKKQFSAVAKDAATNQTALTQGQGTGESPFYQLRVGSDKILMWVGWYVSYEKWLQWRSSILSELLMSLEAIPIELVTAFSSQYAFIVPVEKLNRSDQIPELAPVRAFYGRFVPEELLKRTNAYLTFGDEGGKEILSLLLGGGANPNEGNITFNVRWNAFDSKAGLEQNIRAYTARADKLMESCNSGLLSLLVKS